MTKRKKYKKRERDGIIVRNGRYWYLDCTDPATGKRVYKSLKTTEREAAKLEASEWHRQRTLVKLGLKRDTPSRTLGELVDEYKRYVETQQTKRPNTVRSQVSVMRKFARFMDDERPDWQTMPLGDVDVSLFERYQTARLETGVKPSTVNTEVIVLTTTLNYAVKHSYIPENPIGGAKLAKLQEHKEEVRYLHFDEIDRMKGVLKSAQDMLDFFEVGIGTGFRLGELLHLRWLDVDFGKNRLQVRPQGKEWQPKTRHSVRTIGMREEVREVLERRFAERGSGVYVFGGDRPLCGRWVQKRFQTAYKQAGIKNAGTHSMRHTFGACAVQSGVPLYSVAKLMGHASATVTQKYAHESQQHLDEEINRVRFDALRPRLLEKRQRKCERNVKVQNPAAVSTGVTRG